MISSGITSVGRVSAGQVGSINSHSPWSLPGLCCWFACVLPCVLPIPPHLTDMTSWLDFGPDSPLRTFWEPRGCGPTLVVATRLAVHALGLPWTALLVVRLLSPLGSRWSSPLLLLPVTISLASRLLSSSCYPGQLRADCSSLCPL